MVIGRSKTKYRSIVRLRNILFVLFVGTIMPVHAIQISEYEWKKRPLLVFAASHDDPRLQEIMNALHQRTCDIEDRDMVLGVIIKHGPSRLDGSIISKKDASDLRGHYGIDHDQFAVLLIGKDGGVKYRLHAIPDLDDIFNLIDGMPMRRNEMQQRNLDCSKNRE